MQKKNKFPLVCCIIAAICCSIVGFGSIFQGDTATGVLFLGILAVSVLLLVFWVKRNKKQ